MRILLVEDDELLVQMLAKNLAAQLYAVDTATDGESGWDYAQAAIYDLIVLDVNLPQLDGIRLCQRLRQNNYKGPILLLTAKGDSADKVMGLDSGADDYVVKPCTVEELSARIRALLRRQQASSSPLLEWGTLCLDPSTCTVTFSEQDVSLSAKEYSLLELFLRNPQRVFSSGLILEHLWGFEDAPGEETVRTHIKRLRRKLKAAGAEEVIETVYGMGYRLKPFLEEESAPVSPSQSASEPTSIEPAASTADQARKAAIALWEQFRLPSLERLAVLDQALAALQSGSLSPDLETQASYAAHKLAGSLGMFGFPQGSQLGQQIERWFEAADRATDLALLESWVLQLHQELNQAPEVSDDTDWFASLVETEAEQHQAQPASSPPAQSALESRLAHWQQLQIRVIAVDDDAAVLAMLDQYLPRWGICLQTIEDPRQVWAALNTHAPDLLILDVEMPAMNGIELCHQIRGDRAWDKLPILFLSACKDAETIHRLYGAGADDYLAKPFTEPEVVTRIFNRLERNRLLRS